MLSVVLLLLLGLSLVVTAQPPSVAAALGVRITATANFAGNYLPGQWVPITVSLANDGPGVTGEAVVEVPDSPPLRFTQRVELPTRSQKVLTLYAQVPGRIAAVTVRFEAGKEAVAAPQVTLRDIRATTRLVGVIVDDAAIGAELARAIAAGYSTSRVEVITVAVADIPANTYGLGSFNALIVGDAATGRWDADQRAALANWVARGGQLIVAGGSNWQKTAEGLGELPPLHATNSRTVANLAGLTQIAAGAAPAGQSIVATGDLLSEAVRLAEQEGLPLVAQRNWGSGKVTSLAFDPAANALTSWAGSNIFWRKLAVDTAPPEPLADPFTRGGGSYAGGVSELIQVLRDIPGLALPPTWLLMLVLLAFILLVGLVNYLVLRAIDRRELAWVTIPLITLAFAGVIYGVGTVTKGRSLVLNSASVIRVSPDVRSAEALAFYGIFTPSRGIRDLSFSQEALALPFSKVGLGDVGDLGDDVRFEQGASSTVRAASFAQWTQRTVAAQAMVDPKKVALDLQLRWDGTKVVGVITNNSGGAVEDLLLVYNDQYEKVGALAPGASATINWLPVSSGNHFSSGLGAAYYGYISHQRSLGVDGRRANILNALSGGVIDYSIPSYSSPYQTPTPRPTPTTRPRPGTPTAVPTAVATPATSTTTVTPGGGRIIQVLFWRADAPLDLKITAEERNISTLVIQEAILEGVPQP